MNLEMQVILVVAAMLICKAEQATITRVEIRTNRKNNNYVVGKKMVENMPANMSEVKPPRTVLSQDGLDRILYAKSRKTVRVPRLIRIQSGLRIIPFQEKREGFAETVDQGVLSRIGNFIRNTNVRRFRNFRVSRI